MVGRTSCASARTSSTATAGRHYPSSTKAPHDEPSSMPWRPTHGSPDPRRTPPPRLVSVPSERTLPLTACWPLLGNRIQTRPRFARVESKAFVADDISRGDLSRAHAEGWTRLDDRTPTTRRTRRCTTFTTPPTELALSRCEGLGRVRSAPCPALPSFWRRNVGPRAICACSHPRKSSAQAFTQQRMSWSACMHVTTLVSLTAAPTGSQAFCPPTQP